jgi:hypothetical protein
MAFWRLGSKKLRYYEQKQGKMFPRYLSRIQSAAVKIFIASSK